jgi:hypothetical protein
VPKVLPGQAVDPSVKAMDRTVNSRVQDPDRPDSALLPGGSSAWTGQPIMSRASSTSSQKGSAGKSSQFPSLTSMSTWGTLSVIDSSAQKAASVPDRAGSVLPSTKAARSRKLNIMVGTVDLQSAKSISSQDELAAEQSQQTGTSAALELRKVRQGAAQSARTRITNPLRASADAASAGRWHSDQSSARALAQQQHEAATLLHYGFNAHNKPRRWHRGKKHTPGSHDYSYTTY